eukprot:12830989-Heterocapsa_arctica.AAC.1
MAQQRSHNSELQNEHNTFIQIGANKYPEYPSNSTNEAYYQLGKCVGPEMCIYHRWYRTAKYIIGIDLEKVPGAGFTGISTKSGSQLTVNFRDCEYDHLAGSIPSKVYVCLHYDCIINIRDNGIEILD